MQTMESEEYNNFFTYLNDDPYSKQGKNIYFEMIVAYEIIHLQCIYNGTCSKNFLPLPLFFLTKALSGCIRAQSNL